MASKQEEAQANEKLLEPSPQMPMPHPPPNPYVSNSPPAYSPAVASYPDPAISTAAHSSHVVVTQPGPIIYYPEGAEKVPDYLCCSILTTLCCCLCLGIAAIVTSSQANSLKTVNPRAAADKARTARNLNIAGVVCGIIITAIYVALRLMGRYRY